jgi:DNA-binding LytR/AlgR family response regulator
MKVVIIEDEAPAFRRLQKSLEEFDEEIEIVEVLDSVEESINWIRNHKQPDLFFMDIQLNDGLSFDIFEKAKITSPIIFTTAFDEYLLRAFKVNGIDYLLKPIKKTDLAASLEKYKSLKKSLSNGDIDLGSKFQDLLNEVQLSSRKYRNRLLVKKGEKFISVNINDCAAFYIRNTVVYGHTFDDREYILDTNLEDLSQMLDPGSWYRANRQYLISIKAIENAEKYFKGKLLLNTSINLPDDVVVSAEKASDFKKWFGDE